MQARKQSKVSLTTPQAWTRLALEAEAVVLVRVKHS